MSDSPASHKTTFTDRPSSVASADDAILSITLDRSRKLPLGRQLYAVIRDMILDGRIPGGSRLVSTRQLARELNVSRAVPLEAYAELIADGFVDGQQGSGHYVRELFLTGARGASPPKAQPAAPLDDDAVDAQADLDSQTSALFPHKAWARSLARGWLKHRDSALHGEAAGLPSLREALAAHLYAFRGIHCSADQIVVTSGTQDALTLIFRTFRRRPNPSCWVENPCFLGATRILERESVTAAPVPVDAQGACISAAIDRFADADFALLTPARQFPLGMPLALERRLELLAWAQSTGAVVVEDDFDSEIRFGGRPIQSLASLGSAARVLTLGSFSKLTFPALRLGYAFGSEADIGELVAARRRSGTMIPTAGQVGLVEFLGSGEMGRHLRRLRRHLTERRKVLSELLEEIPHLVTVLPHDVGSHATVLLSGRVRTTDHAIAAAARSPHLPVEPLTAQYLEPPATSGLLVGFGAGDDRQFARAAHELVQAIVAA